MDREWLQVESEVHEELNDRYYTIDGQQLRDLTEAGLKWLRANQELVNALNVFPVPDGDTGTNMTLTMKAACEEIQDLSTQSASEIAKGIAHGALMGARGNSGVILSQLWRGFSHSLEGEQIINAENLTEALVEGKETAYRGVVKPVEGTILTVSKAIANAAEKALSEGAGSALEIMESTLEAADRSVENTPELLPILKDAGVVDAGGKGLFYLLEGMLRYVYQQPLDQPEQKAIPLSSVDLEHAAESVEPGQDWEVVIDFRPKESFDLQDFYQKLENLGTSIQVGEGDGMYRLHIHVPDETEYKPIDYVRTLGTISNVHMENLMEQTTRTDSLDQGMGIRLDSIEVGDIAVVAVAPGMGIGRVFASLGAGAIIQGGQTMNPSTQEILGALENLPTKKVIILPNNKNVLLAANQAAELTVKDVRVVESVTVPQGVTALLNFDPKGDLDEVEGAMQGSLGEVRTGEITKATRSVVIENVEVEEGQVIGLLDNQLAAADDDRERVLTKLLEQAAVDEAELVTFYYGADLPVKTMNALADKVRKRWEHLEVEVVEGGQPHYDIILSVE